MPSEMTHEDVLSTAKWALGEALDHAPLTGDGRTAISEAREGLATLARRLAAMEAVVEAARELTMLTGPLLLAVTMDDWSAVQVVARDVSKSALSLDTAIARLDEGGK